MHPTSHDPKIQLLTGILVSYLEKADVNFCIQESELYPQEVVGHFGCLPLVLLEAQENFDKVFNHDLKMEDFADAFGRQTSEESRKKFFIDGKIKKKSFGIDFVSNQEAYFNAEPVISPESGTSFVVLAHLAHYTLEEYIAYYMKRKELLQNGRIPLDSLYEKWEQAVLNNKIEIKPTAQILSPMSGGGGGGRGGN